MNKDMINPANVENVENTKETKKRRRGLGEVRGASRLKFNEQDYNPANRLFVGHLDSVELAWSTQKEDSQLTSFAGLAVPSLVFTFASNAEKANERKYITLRINPAESNAETIVGGSEEWKVNQPLNWLRHILDVFVLRGKPMTEEMEDALCLPYDDMNDDGEYVPVDAEEVIAGWRTLFENFLNIINNDGKPYYKNDKGGILPIWMKLLRYTKQRNKKTKEFEWVPVATGNQAGDFSFTSFVGDGAIELYNNAKAPLLHVDPAKESVTPKEVTAKPKTPNMPQIPGAGVSTGIPMQMPSMDNNYSQDNGSNGAYGIPVGGNDLPF